MGSSSIADEAVENLKQVVNSRLQSEFLLGGWQAFFFTEQENILFHVYMYLLSCFRQHFQPSMPLPRQPVGGVCSGSGCWSWGYLSSAGLGGRF